MTSRPGVLCLILLAIAALGGCAQFPRNDVLGPGETGGGYNFQGWEQGDDDVLVSDFSADFLQEDMQGGMGRRLLWPTNWFRLMGEEFERADIAAEYLDEQLFAGARFADLEAAQATAPFFLISATDSSWGTRFGFTQDSFDALCSDLGTYPLSRAVTASGAVPVASSPITLESFGWQACGFAAPEWAEDELQASSSRRSLRRARAMDSYRNDGESMRRWTHLIDGGVAGNLGLEGLYEVVFPIEGCPVIDAPRRIVVIVVDAVLELDHCTDYAIAGPDLGQTIATLGNVSIDRLSDHNSDRLHARINKWAEKCTVGDTPNIDIVFVRIPPVADADVHRLLQVETSLSLPCESVDALRCAARDVFDQQAEGLFANLSGRAGNTPDAVTATSSCASPDRASGRRQLDCSRIVSSGDVRQFNKDTPATCGAD